MIGYITNVELLVAGETEVAGENQPQCPSLHYKSHTAWSVIKPRSSVLKAGD
jgi:hypothetical protein